jgi:PAS domain S-box-containing protein
VLPPKHAEEEARLAALRRYAILDTENEPAFDDITRLVAALCDAPVAVINLIDRDRQWFKSEVGLGVRETPLDVSICAHALLQPGVFVVPNTREDERFASNPLVTGEPHLRFYAGALLESSDGYPLGTLCVLDYKPRDLTERQRDALQILARQVMRLIERRASVEALRASEERYRTLFESVDEAFCVIEMIFDEQGCPADYRFLEANPAFERHTGLTGAVGKTARELVPDLDDSWFRTYGAVALTGEPARFENHAPAMDRWFDVYALRVGAPQERKVALLFNDITDRRRAEEALRETETRFRRTADAAPAMLWITDPQNSCAFLSRGWYEFTGQNEEAGLGFGWLDAVHPDDRGRAGEAFLAAAARSEPFALDHRLRRADGAYRWVMDAGRPHFAEDGAFLGYVGSVIDIHERKEAERKVEEYAREQAGVAETLQRSLLLVPPGNAFAGISVEVLYEAASREAMVGGDFSDVFAVEEGRIAFVVGDVTGKGLQAATYTAEIKFALRAFLRESPNPARALDRLNHYLLEAQRLDPAPHGGYVSLAVAVLDTATGALLCSSAGAEPPLIVRSGGADGQAESVEVSGTLLGIDAASEFGAVPARLGRGDLFALTTDGITEARQGRRGDLFGYDRFARAAARAAGAPSLRDAAQAVMAEALDFAGGNQSDDICLLLARRE